MPFIISALFALTFFIGSHTCAAESRPRVHNLAPAFLEFWKSVEDKPVEVQVRLLKQNFFPKFPEFYRFKTSKWEKAGKVPNDELRRVLTEFPAIKVEFARKAEEISRQLAETLASFRKQFPDLENDFEIYVTHSFGEMDGGTRQIDDKNYFILGIDGMVNFHKGFGSEVPFFHHELFHVYHGQFLKEEQILWIALWAEGLATYTAEKMNPTVSLADLMLNIPDGMTKKIDRNQRFHWQDLRAKLTSTTDKDYEDYFLMSSNNKTIVPRAGYYLGYLVAKEIGKTKSIPEMAKLKPKEILALIEATVERKILSQPGH